MPDLLFDKLAYKDRLTRAGVTEETARAHADALDEALRDSVATKADIAGLRAATKADLAQLETRLTLRMGVITAAGVAVLTAIKFFG